MEDSSTTPCPATEAEARSSQRARLCKGHRVEKRKENGDYLATRSSHLTMASIVIIDAAQAPTKTNQQAHRGTLV